MSKHTHTPGPWRVIRKGSPVGFAHYEVAYTDDDELVCDIIYERDDAYLISAAPDLLESLEYAIKQVPDLAQVPGISAAISKAYGGAK